MNIKKTVHKRRLTGIVISHKMKNTVVVRVGRKKLHPKYRKRYTVSKHYKAHDAKEEYVTGERVILEESKPISKDKKWRVVDRIVERVE